MFPPDFGGWKILPRGLMELSVAKQLAYMFFGLAAVIGLYLTFLVGPLVLVLGAIGVFFAYFHVAPPLKLGYRGLGLSEVGIFVSFGLLPVLGSFYIQTEKLSWSAILLGVPIGLLTISILINHDQIFFEAYQKADKRSYAVSAGRGLAMVTTFGATLLSYLIVLALIFVGIVPLSGAFVLGTLPLFVIQVRLYLTPARTPLHFVKLTQATFALCVLFGLLLSLGLMLG